MLPGGCTNVDSYNVHCTSGLQNIMSPNIAPSLITSAVGLFWFQSLLQSKVILLRRAVMVGVRTNIRTATVYRISGLQDNQMGG